MGDILTGENMSNLNEASAGTDLAERVISVIRKAAEKPVEKLLSIPRLKNWASTQWMP